MLFSSQLKDHDLPQTVSAEPEGVEVFKCCFLVSLRAQEACRAAIASRNPLVRCWRKEDHELAAHCLHFPVDAKWPMLVHESR